MNVIVRPKRFEGNARLLRTAPVLVVDGAAGGRALVRDGADGTTLVLVRPDQAPAVEVTDRIFIGTVDDGTPVFAVDAALPSSVPPSSVLSSSVAVPSVADPGLRSVTVREVGHLLPDRDAGLFTTAAAMVSWHARHRYSASSGLPTRASGVLKAAESPGAGMYSGLHFRSG